MFYSIKAVYWMKEPHQRNRVIVVVVEVVVRLESPTRFGKFSMYV